MSQRKTSLGKDGFYLVKPQNGKYFVFKADDKNRCLLIGLKDRPRGPFCDKELALEIAGRFSLPVVEGEWR